MYIHGLMLPFIGISKLKETLLDKKKTINYLENQLIINLSRFRGLLLD